jgi:hypothetical protein
MQRATRKLPTSGYALVVDGHMKAQFETREGVAASVAGNVNVTGPGDVRKPSKK